MFGTDLFGDPVVDKHKSILARTFEYPPFSVLSAREGWWQERKRQWLALGIKSEVGRQENLLNFSETCLEPDPEKRAAKLAAREYGRTFGQDLMRGEHQVGSVQKLAPGGGGTGCWIGGRDRPTGSAPALKEDRTSMEAGLTFGELPNYDGANREQATGTSIFDPVLTELSYRWFCPPGGHILDPFAGGSVRGVVASVLGFEYDGFELRPEQCEANRAQAAEICPAAPPRWHCGDSLQLVPEWDGQADFVFSCPPYGDLEVYSDLPEDISAMSHDDFLTSYRAIIGAACNKLKPNRFAAFVVGDFRCKGGFYRRFVSATEDAFEAAGLRFYNECILVTAVGSLPIRVGKQFKASRKLGKALRNGTPVLTPRGWTEIERLEVGDEVIAGDGSPTRVTGVYPQGVRPLFTVKFHDGSEIDADADHLWSIESRDRGTEVLTTQQIIDQFGHTPRDPRPTIPFCGEVQFVKEEVPVDPYLVGLLLGDGSLTGNTPGFTTADAEIVESLPALLPSDMVVKGCGNEYRLVGTASRSTSNPLTLELRRLGMMGKYSYEKEVPSLYLWNSARVRRAVLQGLMDTDGCVTKSPGAITDFGSTSRRLAEDVVFLARSLGARASMTSRLSMSGRRFYIVRIRGGTCPFRLRRKADLWEAANARRIKRKERYIASIAAAPPGEATCISVAHPSALFVTKDFIVTHNTHQNLLVFVKGDPKLAAQACEAATPKEQAA